MGWGAGDPSTLSWGGREPTVVHEGMTKKSCKRESFRGSFVGYHECSKYT